MGAAQRDGDASRTRKEYSEAVALVHRMHYLLVGAPGTGKSLLLRALLQLMDEEDLGCAIFSAYTGVAVTAAARCHVLQAHRHPWRRGLDARGSAGGF